MYIYNGIIQGRISLYLLNISQFPSGKYTAGTYCFLILKSKRKETLQFLSTIADEQ
jgi:hypothetical protein